MAFSGWTPGPDAVRARDDELHLWKIAVSPRLRAADERILSEGERERASRVARAHPRAVFVGARAGLRRVLARYLDEDPPRVRLRTDEPGRLLPSTGRGVPLRFSVSHSGTRALFAVTRERPVGVDLEEIRPGLDVLALARRFFTPRETEWITGLAPARRVRAFLRLWCSREAWLKAQGLGFRDMAPEEIPLAVGSDGRIGLAGGAARAWRFCDIDLGRRYCSAAAIAGPDPVRLRLFRVSGGTERSTAAERR